MFEIPDDDDNFWETLPIDDITNFSNTKHHPLKSVSPDEPSKKHFENEKSDLQPDTHEDKTSLSNNLLESVGQLIPCAKTPTNVQLSQDSFRSPSFSPLTFSVGHTCSKAPEKEASNKAENMLNENAPSSLKNILHIPTDSKQNGSTYEIPSMKHFNNDSSPVGNILRPVENYVSNHTEAFCYDPKKHSETNGSAHSSPVTPIEKPSKRQWNFNEMSPNVDDFRPKRSRRKFPGPAGVLPKLRPGSKIEEQALATTGDEVKLPEETIILSSQSGDDVFNDEPWHRLLHDLGKGADEILKRFSIFSSLQKAVKKQLPQGKVPLLFAVLESLDFQGTDAGVLLKDKSGKIQGTLHRDLVKEYASCLEAGVAVVLRQVGVISPTSRSHYLNITPNNIVSIYTRHHTENKHFPNTSPQTLEELVTATDIQTQKLSSLTPQRNQSLINNSREVVNTNNKRTNELLRTPLTGNQENKLTMHQDFTKSVLTVSTADFGNTVLMTQGTQKYNACIKSTTPNLSSLNISPESMTGSSTRSCQLQSSNGMSTPVRKLTFKPSGNSTPKSNGNISAASFNQSGNGTPFKPSGNISAPSFKPSGNSTPFKISGNISTSFKPGSDNTPKQSGNSTPFKISGNISTSFKPGSDNTPKQSGNIYASPFKSIGNITSFNTNENTTSYKPNGNAPLQMQKGINVNVSRLKTAHNGQTSVSSSTSTVDNCRVNMNAQTKNLSGTESIQSCAFKTSSHLPGYSDGDFNSNKTNIEKPIGSNSTLMPCDLKDKNGSAVKRPESGTSKEWDDDGDWQNSDLDELLSRMSEDV